MSKYRLTIAARDDLSSIWDYSAQRWDTEQAGLYIREIVAGIERVADDPRRGRPCDDIREGYRRYAIGSHLIFFVERRSHISVIRILHQRMDPQRHM